MRTLPYSVLDVFAERPLEGNPLAVFHDARGLTAHEMQAIAREMNLSETAFVFPGEDPANDLTEGVRVRIFTTQEELPFAGHPTLGTASWLHAQHPATKGAEEVTLRLGVGPIRVRFEAGSGSEAGVFATMQQNDPEFGAECTVSEVADVIGVDIGDFLQNASPQSVSTGNAFCIAALRSIDVLSRLDIPQREATEWLRARGMRWFYCIAPEDAETPTAGRWRARMQFYGGEDPATGSAAGPCIAWLVKRGFVQSGENATIRQGVEIARPSLISGRASLSGERVHSVLVGGRTIPVAAGSFSCVNNSDSHRRLNHKRQ